MPKIQFENGSTVTIRDGFVQAATPELTAILNEQFEIAGVGRARIP